MNIQLSPKRIIENAITVWSEPGPEVDIVMNLKHLTFRPGSISTIYAFHVMDHLFPDEALEAVKNWYQCLEPKGGTLHTFNDDFEYIARAFVGGDISIDLFNDIHNHPCQCNRENVSKMMFDSGFKDADVSIWIDGSPEGYIKKHYEVIITGKKHE